MSINWIFIHDKVPTQYGVESTLIGNVARSLFSTDVDEKNAVDISVSSDDQKSLLHLHHYIWSLPFEQQINVVDLTGLDGGAPISEWLHHSFSRVKHVTIYGTCAALLSKTRDKLVAYQVLMGQGIAVLPYESSHQGDARNIRQWLQYCEFENFKVAERNSNTQSFTFMAKKELKKKVHNDIENDLIVMADMQYQPHYAIMPAHNDLPPILITEKETGWEMIYTDKGNDLLATAQRVWQALGVEKAFLSIELFNDSLSSRVVDVNPVLTETTLGGLVSVANKYQWEPGVLKNYLFG